MKITDIIKEFAKWGHTETPLTIAEMEQCIKWGFNMDTIYQLGCDLANGWRYSEVIDMYYTDHIEQNSFF
jgi:hypothetical protein